jgi:hypothetical protein
MGAVSLRRSGRAFGAVALTALLLTLSPGPVSGLEREGFTVAHGQDHEEEYPAMVGSTGLVLIWWPRDCAVATWCDTIPMDVVVPDIDPDQGDNFIVEVILDWESTGGAEADVDLYIFDDMQIDEEAGEDNPDHSRVADSATVNKPERAIMFEPTLGRYMVTAQLVSGQISSYSITARLHVLDGGQPFELLAPTPTRRQEPSSSGAAAPAPTTTTTTTVPAAPSAEADSTETAVILEPAELTDDSDFATGVFGDSDFDDQLAAPGPDPDLQARLAAAAAAASRPPAPPSTFALVFWLALVPAVLVAGAAVLLSRRRRESLAF